MVRQYHRIKAEHPEDILLFRVGDFYETFGDDAHEASAILGITLTKKHVGNGRTLPLAGIPYHALDSYLGRLVRAGKRVAICEQVEDASESKGSTVERAVVRVVTPGTLIEDNLLEDKTHNYLVTIARHRGQWGLARCDISTGELAATQFDGPDPRAALMDELARIGPAELAGTEDDLAVVESGLEAAIPGVTRTRIDAGLRRLESAREALLEHLEVHTLGGFGAEDKPAAVSAAGALVGYLRETQRRVLRHIHRLQVYSTHEYLFLDAVTQRSLELVHNLIDGRTRGTLLEVLDQTRTPMGARLLRQWVLQPLQSLEEITARQEGVGSLINSPSLRDQLGESLRGVRDLERILSRVHCRTANARDLVSLARSLREIPSIKSALIREGKGRLAAIGKAMETLSGIADRLEGALMEEPPVSIREGGMIRDGFDAELDRLREISRGGKSWISSLKKQEVERTGISSLKIGYNRVFGYYIEITKAHAAKVPDDYERRQTLTNAERYITPELKQKESEILGAQDKIFDLEAEIFERLRAEIEEDTGAIQTLAAHIAETDAMASLAEAAREGGFIRPEVDASDLLEIRGGRHPVVEAQQGDRPFVPNDLRLDSKEEQIWLITGPNMAGKSTFIRQTAIITLLAHIGSYVPARSARIGLTDRIFTRVGATDYLTRGQSTFLVEMTETANILNNATDRSLVILDEIGRGTSTYDGLSIAWAVAEYLHNSKGRRARTLFATHYHELADLETRLPRLKNYNVAVKEDGESITFLYLIQRGGSDHSYGIHAARLAGIPQAVVSRAREILFELECAGPVAAEAATGEASGARKLPQSASADPMQPDLFAPSHNKVVDALLRVDVNRLSPIEALQFLDQLQRSVRDDA